MKQKFAILLGLSIFPLLAADPQGFVVWPKGVPPADAKTSGRFANHAGHVVAAADTAGLSYLQHIVAVNARLHGERLLVPTTTPPRPTA